MTDPSVSLLIGAAIRNKRFEMGISQEELAVRSGLHRTYISGVERGARNPSLGSIEKLTAALGVSVGSLFGRRGSEGKISENLPRILLVEDDPGDTQLTLRAFKMAKMVNPVDVVRDGEEALEFLFSTGRYAKNRDEHFPGVILLDLNLPKINGVEVLRRVKADSRTQKIPVVILSASNHDCDIDECRRLGAETYIVKPVGFQNFSAIAPRLEMEWALVKPLYWPMPVPGKRPLRN